MKYLIGLCFMALAGCAPYTPLPATGPQNYANRCLHFDECDGRPYPRPLYASGIDPKYLVGDEGLGVSSPGNE